jgi:antitoxin (DNA-binding transcriptional repressor) of toxin-antitoxin stability system
MANLTIEIAEEERYHWRMTMITEVGAAKLTDLVKQVQAGNDVLLAEGDKPVARLVPARDREAGPSTALRIRSLKGHQVLTPAISQAELAEEMFGHS